MYYLSIRVTYVLVEFTVIISYQDELFETYY